jgi:predicted nucleic acid-binding protein
MTTLVVDASVVAKWFFPEEHSRESRRLLSSRHTLLAPDLIWSEFGNIVWKRLRRGELTAEEARELVADLSRMPLEIGGTQDLLAPALELAAATDRTVYDCMYLALAMDRRCRLATADERFVNALAATPFAKHVRHVAKLR